MVTIDGIQFDRARYDRDADVLYLAAGDPARARDFDGTPEGHHVWYDERGRLIGVTFVGAADLLRREGRLSFTEPLGAVSHSVEAGTLAGVLAA
ncbi:MAG TPA: DUF2283 domain-containing protein [Solirubrobacteraceae bacterium]|nr:DUF2283 domain-containing protein [Solirubrobacteraceae bacterium]